MKKSELKLLIKEIVSYQLLQEAADMGLMQVEKSSTFQDFLKKFVGLTLKDFQDKTSYINLYFGNVYGMTRNYEERPLQDLFNLVDTYLFQRILWTKLGIIQKKKIWQNQRHIKKNMMNICVFSLNHYHPDHHLL